MKYRKKPVVIDAIEFDGTESGVRDVIECLGIFSLVVVTDDRGVFCSMTIPTLEGNMRASPGDFIIRGIKGEFYPCRPDIFAATYESVGDTVNHPPHYASHPSGVECVDIAEHLGFNLGNALKYVWRAENKGHKEEDLRKCLWYLERELRSPETGVNLGFVQILAQKTLDKENPDTVFSRFLTALVGGFRIKDIQEVIQEELAK